MDFTFDIYVRQDITLEWWVAIKSIDLCAPKVWINQRVSPKHPKKDSWEPNHLDAPKNLVYHHGIQEWQR